MANSRCENQTRLGKTKELKKEKRKEVRKKNESKKQRGEDILIDRVMDR